MVEDRVGYLEKNGEVLSYTPRQRHSSVISSCSEDAETESTSTGYPPTPDEEKEEELEYGPGIVNKLKTRFLTITLKQNRGMRRSCSMENLLEPDGPSTMTDFSQANFISKDIQGSNHQAWGNLKRAKSMDTLLMDLLQSESQPINGDIKREPKIVRRKDGGLLRSIPTICDEELPKPDTVKTYKRMFEPAESRRGSCSRKPPVLRASAKSGTMSVSKISNGVSSGAKQNGIASKNKLSAKPSSNKAQPDTELSTRNNANVDDTVINGGTSKPMCNGNYVKAIPIKITDNVLCNGKVENTLEKKNNLINNVESKKVVTPQNGTICNGKSSLEELIKTDLKEEILKPEVKKLSQITNKPVVNCTEAQVNNVSNGIKIKPKVPPNRPAFIKNIKHGLKLNEQNGIEKKNSMPKIKPIVAKKISDIAKCNLSPKIGDSLPKINGEIKKDKEIIPGDMKDKIKSVKENNCKNIEKVPIVSGNGEIGGISALKKPELNGHTNGYFLSHESPIKNFKPTLPGSKPMYNSNDKSITNIDDLISSPKVNEVVLNLKVSNLESIPKSATVGSPKIENLTSNLKVDNVNNLTPSAKFSNLTGSPKVANLTSTPNSSDIKQCEKISNFNKPIDKSEDVKTSSAVVDSKSTGNVADVKAESRPIKKQSAEAVTTSVVFDFRGKDVVSHIALLPTPFGCKALHPKKKLVDGKDVAKENGVTSDDEDEYHMDYSVPPPCGVKFEGENIRIGKGSILATRNKDLKIKFDESLDENTFVYPSENSLLEDEDHTLSPTIPPSTSPLELHPTPITGKLKNTPAIGNSSAGGLSTYTPSVLRTMDNFEPGMFRPPPAPSEKEDNMHSGEEENTELRDENTEEITDMLKPADPGIISSWSISAGTSDILF